MPGESDAIFDSGDANNPSFADVSFENERTLWRAEFDSIGEEAVRGYVARNSYSPTGMEIARQWLAQRERLQSRGDVQSSMALAEQAQGVASVSLGSVSEALTPASTASAAKNLRAMLIGGIAASLAALCATMMVLASSRHVAPNTKQASAQSSRPDQAVARALPPAAAPQQALPLSPENAQTEQPSTAPLINAPAPKPEGQSLAKALSLIADKVGGEGTVNFTVQLRDAATGQDQYEQHLYKASNVTADPSRCQLRYRWHSERAGTAASDQDRTVELRLARSVRVTSIAGEPGGRSFVRAYPNVQVVRIAGRNNASGHNFYFYDKDMAARVVTSARRAVELCGKRAPQLRGG